MAQADTIPNTSRRWFLGGMAKAAVAVPVLSSTVAATVQPASSEPFNDPSEYLAAMLAIGWHPVAMFQRLEDGGVHRMGVNERAPQEATVDKNWFKFHAIQMRTPVQAAADMPQGDWWKRVWQYLYDSGLREDVTLKRDADPEDPEALS